MYCPKCNSYVEEGMSFCPHCGQELSQRRNSEAQAKDRFGEANFQQSFENQSFENNATQNPYNQNNPNTQVYALKSELDTAKILGIVSIVCAVIGFHIVGIILGAIGSEKASRVLIAYPSYYEAIDAKKYCKIGIILSVVFIALTAVFAVIIGIVSVLYGTSLFAFIAEGAEEVFTAL